MGQQGMTTATADIVDIGTIHVHFPNVIGADGTGPATHSLYQDMYDGAWTVAVGDELVRLGLGTIRANLARLAKRVGYVGVIVIRDETGEDRYRRTTGEITVGVPEAWRKALESAMQDAQDNKRHRADMVSSGARRDVLERMHAAGLIDGAHMSAKVTDAGYAAIGCPAPESAPATDVEHDDDGCTTCQPESAPDRWQRDHDELHLDPASGVTCAPNCPGAPETLTAGGTCPVGHTVTLTAGETCAECEQPESAPTVVDIHVMHHETYSAVWSVYINTQRAMDWDEPLADGSYAQRWHRLHSTREQAESDARETAEGCNRVPRYFRATVTTHDLTQPESVPESAQVDESAPDESAHASVAAIEAAMDLGERMARAESAPTVRGESALDDDPAVRRLLVAVAGDKETADALTSLSEAERFFFENAPFSYDPKTETVLAGRIRTARDLAAAERRMNDGPYFTEVQPDDTPGEYVVSLRRQTEDWGSTVIGTMGAVQADRDTHPYFRVVSAELALQYIPAETVTIQTTVTAVIDVAAWILDYGIEPSEVQSESLEDMRAHLLAEFTRAKWNGLVRDVQADGYRMTPDGGIIPPGN